MTTLQASQVGRTRSRRGQTLIIALIVLGVLLALGLVFLGIVSRNVASTALNQRRSVASDLSESGVEFAHRQLQFSLSGADWRPGRTPVNLAGPNTSKDPDLLYIRPGTGFGLRSDTDTLLDLGGPDGLGPYSRLDTQNGRTLVRVRYAPSDANIFNIGAAGPLRNPGRARMYTIVESVGRPGKITFNDPTSLATALALQFQGFADGNAFRLGLGLMRKADTQIQPTSKSIAFVSIPMLQSLTYYSNKDKVNRPVEIGIDRELNVIYKGVDIASGEEVATGTPVTRPLSLELGSALPLFNFGNPSLGIPPTPTLAPVGLGGSIMANSGVRIHGLVRARVNSPLGDLFATSDLFIGADDQAQLEIERNFVDATGMWQPPVVTTLQNATDPSLNSRSATFSTNNGSIRDGRATSDRDGYQRGVGTVDAPSMQLADPDTGQTRYRTMSREGGVVIGGVNSGRYGHGRNPYIDNTSDRQMRLDEQGRERLGTAESQVYDWLNPNNGQAGSGWVGPFYVPRGAFVLLLHDGFVIVRDARGPDSQKFWKSENGAPTVDYQGNPLQSGTVRYRFGYDAAGLLKIANSFTPDPIDPTRSVDINGPGLNFDDIGQPFGGVLYFEGNVRVRGTIPTNVQITLVSNATIYIEGSISKGIVDFGGGTLAEPTRSMLMLMAKDYVALNTTQFFGSGLSNALEEANDIPSAVSYNPVRMRVGGSGLSFMVEFPLDSSADPLVPSLWPPYAVNYREFNDPLLDNGAPLASSLLVTHTMDDGPAPATFISMNVNNGLDNPDTALGDDWPYLFEMTDNNAATQPFIDAGGYALGDFIPMYGLGVETWQRHPRFETISFPLVENTTAVGADGLMKSVGNKGTFALFSRDLNEISLYHNNVGPGSTNDYLLARAAIAPHDVKIEASVYAEDGAFFVIPGPPFNANPNDRREVFEEAVVANGGFALADAIRQAQRERLENFGAFPETPFYGEPLDVKITLLGSVSQNMPPSIDQQAHWIRRWGWIPAQIGCLYDFSFDPARPVLIPKSHVPAGFDIRPSVANADMYVPNLVLTYDPTLGTGRVGGFDPTQPVVRQDAVGNTLPPLPRLPVSGTRAYFGEVNP